MRSSKLGEESVHRCHNSHRAQLFLSLLYVEIDKHGWLRIEGQALEEPGVYPAFCVQNRQMVECGLFPFFLVKVLQGCFGDQVEGYAVVDEPLNSLIESLFLCFDWSGVNDDIYFLVHALPLLVVHVCH